MDLILFIIALFIGFLLNRCILKQKISIKYLLVEVLNGLAYVLLYSVYGLSIQFIGMAFLASSLIVISFIDFEHMLIPNNVLIVLFVAGVMFNILNSNLTIMDSVIGFFAASVPLFLIAIFTKGGMGGGDIKLMAVVGIFIGWKLVTLSLIIGACMSSVIGIILLLFRVVKRKEPIPFGPFLATGSFIAMVYGSRIIQWYMIL